MKQGNKDGKDIYFCIMANLFDSPVETHELYDLKGSTVNRSVTLEVPNSNIALKDLDFHRKIYISGKQKARLLQQAEIDCRWMESFNICDYSLLVGFHFGDKPPEKSKTLARSHFNKYQGGIVEKYYNKKGKIVYFIGIIDILTQYDLKKKSEHVFKSLMYNKHEISAIAPEPYRKRFLKYLVTIFQWLFCKTVHTKKESSLFVIFLWWDLEIIILEKN